MFMPVSALRGSSDESGYSSPLRGDLSELIQSISTSGYINIEQLIVIERRGRLAVLEGNRRLAAVKALRDPELAKEARICSNRNGARHSAYNPAVTQGHPSSFGDRYRPPGARRR